MTGDEKSQGRSGETRTLRRIIWGLVLPLALLLGVWAAYVYVVTRPSGEKPAPVVREQMPSYAVPVAPAAGTEPGLFERVQQARAEQAARTGLDVALASARQEAGQGLETTEEVLRRLYEAGAVSPEVAALSTEDILQRLYDAGAIRPEEAAGGVPSEIQQRAAELRRERAAAEARARGKVRFFDMTLDTWSNVGGRVENRSDRVLRGVIVDVWLYDTNGQCIDSCSGTDVGRWGLGLCPGGVASFSFQAAARMRFPSKWSWTSEGKPVFAASVQEIDLDAALEQARAEEAARTRLDVALAAPQATDPVSTVLVVVGVAIGSAFLAAWALWAAISQHYENRDRSKAFWARIWRAIRLDWSRAGFEGNALMKNLSRGLLVAGGVLAALLALYELTWWQGSGVAKVLVGFGLAILLLAAGTFLGQEAGWGRSSTSTSGSKTGLDKSGEPDRNV